VTYSNTLTDLPLSLSLSVSGLAKSGRNLYNQEPHPECATKENDASAQAQSQLPLHVQNW